MEVNMAALDKPPIYIGLLDGSLPQQTFHYLKESALRLFGRSTEALPELIISVVPTKTIDNVVVIDTGSLPGPDTRPDVYAFAPWSLAPTIAALAITGILILLAAAGFLWRARTCYLINAQQQEQDELHATTLQMEQASTVALQRQQDNAAAASMRNSQQAAAAQDAAKDARIAALQLTINSQSIQLGIAASAPATAHTMLVEKDDRILRLANEGPSLAEKLKKQSIEIGGLRKTAAALKGANTSIKSLEAELEGSRKENEAQEVKQTLQELELRELRKERDEELQGSMEQVDKLNAALAAKSADHATMETLLARKDEELREYAQVAALKLSAVKSKLAEASESAQGFESAARGAHDTAKALNAKHSALEAAQRALKATNEKLEASVQRIRIACEHSNAAQESLKQDVVSALDANAKCEATITAEVHSRMELARVHALTLLRKDALEDSNIESQNQVAEMQLEIDALKNHNEELDVETNALQEELNALKLNKSNENNSASSPPPSVPPPGSIDGDDGQNDAIDGSNFANVNNNGSIDESGEHEEGPEKNEELDEGRTSSEDDAAAEQDRGEDAEKPDDNDQDVEAEDEEKKDANGGEYEAATTESGAYHHIAAGSNPEAGSNKSQPAGENKKRRKTRGRKPWVKAREEWEALQEHARTDRAKDAQTGGVEGTATVTAVPPMAPRGLRWPTTKATVIQSVVPRGPLPAAPPGAVQPIRRRGQRDAPMNGSAVNGPAVPPTGPRSLTGRPPRGSRGLTDSRWSH